MTLSQIKLASAHADPVVRFEENNFAVRPPAPSLPLPIDESPTSHPPFMNSMVTMKSFASVSPPRPPPHHHQQQQPQYLFGGRRPMKTSRLPERKRSALRKREKRKSDTRNGTIVVWTPFMDWSDSSPNFLIRPPSTAIPSRL